MSSGESVSLVSSFGTFSDGREEASDGETSDDGAEIEDDSGLVGSF